MLAQETIAGSAVEYANEVYAKLGQEVKARAQAGKLGYLKHLQIGIKRYCYLCFPALVFPGYVRRVAKHLCKFQTRRALSQIRKVR